MTSIALISSLGGAAGRFGNLRSADQHGGVVLRHLLDSGRPVGHRAATQASQTRHVPTGSGAIRSYRLFVLVMCWIVVNAFMTPGGVGGHPGAHPARAAALPPVPTAPVEPPQASNGRRPAPRPLRLTPAPRASTARPCAARIPRPPRRSFCGAASGTSFPLRSFTLESVRSVSQLNSQSSWSAR